MELMYGNYGINEFSGMYGKKTPKIDTNSTGSRIIITKNYGNLSGKKIVIEQYDANEYVLHLKERLDLFYNELINGSLKNIDQSVREELLLDIKKTYDRMITTVSPDKVNRITLPETISSKVPEHQNQVILKGNNTTLSLFLTEEDYQKSIIR